MDTIYLFLDTNGEVPYGFEVNVSFHANQLIEITGQYGVILSSVIYNFSSVENQREWSWSYAGEVYLQLLSFVGIYGC